MSFGFGIGDFIAVLDRANSIRVKFVSAPSQFKALADEYARLYDPAPKESFANASIIDLETLPSLSMM